METEEILVAIQKAAETIASPNWADVASVCFSLAAVVVAVIIALKQNEISNKQASIADKQNRIALFEKRLEIYELLTSCSSSANILKMVDNNESILKYLFIVFADDPQKQNKFDSNEARLYLTNCSVKLQQAIFFFSEEVIPYITDVSVELLILANADVERDEPEKFDEKKQRYFEAVNNLDQSKVLQSIKAEMKMI